MDYLTAEQIARLEALKLASRNPHLWGAAGVVAEAAILAQFVLNGTTPTEQAA